MVDYVRQMTENKSWKYGEYGSFEHLLFFVLEGLFMFVFQVDDNEWLLTYCTWFALFSLFDGLVLVVSVVKQNMVCQQDQEEDLKWVEENIPSSIADK